MNDEKFLLNDVLKALIEPIIRDAVIKAINQETDEDRLLDAEEAAKLLSVSQDWLYRNNKKLLFTRKLGRKMLRFSYQGILKYLQTTKLS